MTTTTAVWRRLDAPGHDACRLTGDDGGWQIDGTAIFVQDGRHGHLAYRVACGPDWVTRDGTVRGWVGARSVDLVVQRSAEGEWTVNDARVTGVDGLVDLDLGFTPATNLLQLRRIDLREGEGKDVPVAWLNVGDGSLSLLHQRYERRTARTYWYEAPRFQYAATLDVDDAGFPKRYPDLWEAQG